MDSYVWLGHALRRRRASWWYIGTGSFIHILVIVLLPYYLLLQVFPIIVATREMRLEYIVYIHFTYALSVFFKTSGTAARFLRRCCGTTGGTLIVQYYNTCKWLQPPIHDVLW